MNVDLKYIASSGNVYNLKGDGIRTKTANYHKWNWGVNGTTLQYGIRVSDFKRDPATYETKLIMHGSYTQRKALLDALHDDFELDVRNMTLGRIVWGDYYIDCYILMSSTYPDENNVWTDNDLTIYCPYPFWIREEARSFYPQESPGVVEKTVTGAEVIFDDAIASMAFRNAIINIPYTEGGIDSISIKRTGKNLIPYPYLETTRTANGLTFTDNGDGTITVNGTATATTVFQIKGRSSGNTLGLEVGTEYTISGCPNGGSGSTYKVDILKYSSTAYATDYGNGASFTYSEATANDVVGQIRIVFYTGATVSNLVFKPMIRLASDTDDTWEKYYLAETYMIQFPETIYGGTLDVITGNLEAIYSSDGTVLETPIGYQVVTTDISILPETNVISTSVGEITIDYYAITETYLDYPIGYEYDYYYGSPGLARWERNFPWGCEFRLTLYGPSINPQVTINGHPYLINDTLEASDYVVIDSRSNKVTKYLANGTTLNIFDLRGKVNSVFQQIPGGTLTMNWAGTWGFDLTLFEERSEPRWIMS